MSKLGYGLESSAGVMAACMVIARMPTNVSCAPSLLKPPMRRVMAAKAGIIVAAVDMMDGVWLIQVGV